jgi:4,5-DOPA dioxygenase extradiol
MNTSFPLLFVSHGAPMFAIEPGLAGQGLAELGRELPRPDAIVILSPHWMTRGEISVTASIAPETIHDFGGFPDALYQLRYPAPGAPALAAHIVDLLQNAGWKSRLDARRGLDHGAWVPLLHLAPEADVPVVQVSMPASLDTHQAWKLGQALKPLRDMNVLIVASGSLTHNLYEFRGAARHGADYVKEFAAWTAQTLQAGNTDFLLDYKQHAPSAERAHPTDEHFLPLLIALGAAGEHYETRVLEGGVSYGVLAMDSYLFSSNNPGGFDSTQPSQGVTDHA